MAVLNTHATQGFPLVVAVPDYHVEGVAYAFLWGPHPTYFTFRVGAYRKRVAVPVTVAATMAYFHPWCSPRGTDNSVTHVTV
jgi:hypothetical protein